MTLVPRLWFCAAAAGALLASCGAKPVSLDDACLHAAEARCQKEKDCTNNWQVGRDHGDEATCLAEHKQICIDSVLRDKSANTPQREDACAGAMEQQTCAEWLTLGSPPACESARGPLADGVACVSNNQCLSQYCPVANTAVCGVCTRRIPENGMCASSTACESGLVCVTPDQASSMKICTRRRQKGEACNAMRGCDQGLNCVGVVGTADGTCQPLVTTTGQACDRARRTLSDCDSRLGLFCHPMAMVCQVRPLVRAGEVCGTIGDVMVSCLAGGNCRKANNMASTPTTCIAPGLPGGSCVTSDSPACSQNLRCVPTVMGMTAGSCQPRDYSTCGM